MIESSDFRNATMPLNHGAGQIPVLGFGTLIPDARTTVSATRNALEAGFATSIARKDTGTSEK
jgi:alcohol dehydrogenase (NADP+)